MTTAEGTRCKAHLTPEQCSELRRIGDVLDGALADLREMRKGVTRRHLAETGPYAPLEMPVIQLNGIGTCLKRVADDSEAREREAKARRIATKSRLRVVCRLAAECAAGQDERSE